MTRDELLELHAELCRRAREVMVRKNADYANEEDPFANFNFFGKRVAPIGITFRLGDKISRLNRFAMSGVFQVKDEAVLDTVLDSINYLVLLYGVLMDAGMVDERDG